MTGTALIGTTLQQAIKCFLFNPELPEPTNAWFGTWLARVSGNVRIMVQFRAPRVPGWIGHDNVQLGNYGVDYWVTDMGPG